MHKEYQQEIKRLSTIFIQLNRDQPRLYTQKRNSIALAFEDQIFGQAFEKAIDKFHLQSCLGNRSLHIADIFLEWHQRLANAADAKQHLTTELTYLLTHENFLELDRHIPRERKLLPASAARAATAAQAEKQPVDSSGGGGGAAPEEDPNNKIELLLRHCGQHLEQLKEYCEQHSLPEKKFEYDYYAIIGQLTSIIDHKEFRGNFQPKKILVMETIQGQIFSRDYLTSEHIPKFKAILLKQTSAFFDILLKWEQAFNLNPQSADFDQEAAQAYLTKLITNHILQIDFHAASAASAPTSAASRLKTHHQAISKYIKPHQPSIIIFCRAHSSFQILELLDLIQILFKHVEKHLNEALVMHNHRMQAYLQKNLHLPRRQSESIIAHKLNMIRIGIRVVWKNYTHSTAHPYLQYLFIEGPTAAEFMTAVTSLMQDLIIAKSQTIDKILNIIASQIVGIVTQDKHLAAFKHTQQTHGSSARLKPLTAADAAASLASTGRQQGTSGGGSKETNNQQTKTL